ncbi:peroxidasin [Trichonephila clavata]|uniref:Peroxidasin n=1 Tax=Trichonephila clavata TaxID=2740835 RepID=A0A8X6JES8_TRICU|nr:peroxidasin [Trichonephila clavata]
MYGALVGPTFGCIISKQFINLRNCDRFWYETQDPFLRFTQDQLTEIRQTRLSKVICDNSDTIDVVQMKAFDLPDDFLNPRMPCKNIPSPDLSKWKEKTSCNHRTDRERINIAMGHSHRISPCVTCSCTKEGMVCQSMKISNCFQLASTYTREMILDDDVCKVQCAFAFRAYPQFETNLDNVLGFTVNEK